MIAEPAVAVSVRPGGVRLRAVVVAVVFVLAGFWLGALAPAAQAVPKQIGGVIGGDTGVFFTPTGPGGFFNQPRDVAVYEGNVSDPDDDKIYVVEAQASAQRVQRFDGDGNFELAWGRDVVKPGAPNDLGTGPERCDTTSAAPNVFTDCQFGGGGTLTPQAVGSLGGEFNNPQGIAVNQATGNVYVMDRSGTPAGGRIQEFDADGVFVRAIGKNVGGVGIDVCTVALSCVAATPGVGAGQLGISSQTGQGIALSPVSGDIFVSDATNRRILQYDSGGNFLRAWGYNVSTAGASTFEVCVAADCQAGAAAGTANGNFANNPLRLTVDSHGIVYVGDASAAAAVAGANRIVRFDSDLAPGAPGDATGALLDPIACCDTPGSTPLATGTTLGLKIDRDTDGAGADEEHLVILRRNATGGATTIQEFDIPAVPGDPITTAFEAHPLGVLPSNTNGLGVNSPAGLYYAAFGNTQMGGITNQSGLLVVAPPAGPLVATATSPANLTGESATLRGTVNAGGSASYQFEVAKGGGDFSPIGQVRYASGAAAVDVATEVDGLDPNTIYRVRLRVRKVTGVTTTAAAESNEQFFITQALPPVVETITASSITDMGVRLVGRVDPNGSPTTYYFEYGTTASYGNQVPAQPSAMGSGVDPEVVSQEVDDLLSGTTYHYRIVASNGVGGLQFGIDRTFTTKPATESSPDGRAYELVSPADKIGGVGVGMWPGGIGHMASAGVAAYTGERFMVGGSYGSPLDGNSAHGYTNDWAFAERAGQDAGWLSHSPITHPNYQPQLGQFLQMTGVSEDLSRLVMTGGNITPSIFPEMGADNRWGRFSTSFFLDWGDPPAQPTRWELLGPANLDQRSVATNAATDTDIWQAAPSADGSALVGQTSFDAGSPPRASVFGLAGEGDPTWPAFGDLVAGRSIYLADTSGPPADTFAGTGPRELVNVCTGDGGSRTQLPAVSAGGLLEGNACPPAEPDTDSHLISDRGAVLSTPISDTALNGTISRDGSRVFFMSPDVQAVGVAQQCTGTGGSTSCPPQLYVRQENPDGTVDTRWISKAVPGLFGTQAATLTGSVFFEGATPSGDRVFFRTNSPLTPDDPNGLGTAPAGGVKTGVAAADSWDLYMYEFPEDPDADIDAGELTRISSGPETTGDCNSPFPTGHPAPQLNWIKERAAALRFASEDGRRVYFVCSAPLSGVSASAGGSMTAPGGTTATQDQANLYLYDEHKPADQRWTFVARLPRATGGVSLDICASSGASRRSPLLADSGGAGPDIQVGGAPGAGSNCFNGTPDGAFVTLFTTGRLTADDPASPLTGDVYGYDAEANELNRVSAVQGGAGGSYLCAPGKPGEPQPTDTAQCFGDGGTDLQSAVTGARGGVVNPGLGVVTHPESGQDRIAFFESRSRLVAGDLDDGYDVYQWRNGELSLITSGAADSKHALYKGNTRHGRNVFFVTRERLTWQDYDDVADVYTARVGGGIDPPSLPPLCDVLAGACQDGGNDPLAAPDSATSSLSGEEASAPERTTLTLSGPGAKARARATRTGVLAIRVNTSKAGTVKALARAKIAGRVVKVASARKQMTRAGQATIKLRLSRRARSALRTGRVLRLNVKVSQPGARTRTATVRLERGPVS